MLQSGHSKATTDRIVAWVGAERAHFAELVAIVLGPDALLAQRAAWPMNYCVEHHPQLLRPHAAALVALLGRRSDHPALRRNVFRMLSLTSVPAGLETEVFSAALDALGADDEPVAVKAYAMTLLAELAPLFPGSEGEIRALVCEQLPRQSAAFRSRARHLFGLTP